MLLISLTSAYDYRDPDNRREIEKSIIALGQGDNDALEAIYNRTKAAVYGFSLSILKNTHDAEDVLQETYIRVYSFSGRYRPQGNPLSWILAIARNLSLEKVRERSRRQDYEEQTEGFFVDRGSQATNDEKIILEEVMKTLPAQDREIIMLHAVAGLKHREIAGLMGLPISTVLSKYSRSLKKLKEILKGE